MSIERLRALEKDIRESVALADAEALGVMGINRPARWADELASLIAELGQEVGAVAWIAPSSLESLNICRKDEHNGFVEVWMRPDEHRTIPLYTSPAHTSEARDAARYRWLAENAIIQWPGVTHIGDDPASTRLPLDNAIDAAMRQEGGTP